MSELNNNQENLENNDTFIQDDTSFEVKESLFDKIKSVLTRPRLGPGNNVKTTNMSFDSWSFRATFRKAFEAVSNGMSNLMRKKEPEIKNGFSTVVIGDEEKSVAKDINVNSKEDIKAPNVFIPGLKGKPISSQNKSAPDLLVGNTHTKSSREDIEIEDLKVETIDINKDNLLQETEDKEKESVTKTEPAIKPEVINIGTQTKDKQLNKDEDQDLSI